MKFNPIFHWGMYNWCVTPSLSIWRNRDGGGIVIHFLRGRIGFYISGMPE